MGLPRTGRKANVDRRLRTTGLQLCHSLFYAVNNNIKSMIHQLFDLKSLAGMVDTIFADVAQPDQARIVAINAHQFLKNGGHFVISIKVRAQVECIYW